jgi:hypothetical protein
MVKHKLPAVAEGARVVGIEGRNVIFEHQPCEKARVLLPIRGGWVCSKEDYAAGVAGLIGALQLTDIVDICSRKAEQCWFLPRAPQDQHALFQSFAYDGCWLTATDLEKLVECGRAIIGREHQRMARERRERLTSLPPLPGGLDLNAWEQEYGTNYRLVEALRESFAQNLGGEDSVVFTDYVNGDKVHIICPYEADHTTESKDQDCFVANGGPGTRYSAGCLHAHCQGRTSLDFVAQFARLGVLTPELLTDPRFAVSTLAGLEDLTDGAPDGSPGEQEKAPQHGQGQARNGRVDDRPEQASAAYERTTAAKANEQDHNDGAYTSFAEGTALAQEGALQALAAPMLEKLIRPANIQLPDDELWLVDELLPPRAMMFLYADYSHGKSALAFHLIACLSAGKEFFGRAGERVPVLYIMAEGQGGLAKRIAALRQFDNLPDTAPWEIYPQSVDLGNVEQMRQLAAMIRILKRRYEASEIIVVLDTWFAMMPGRGENDSVDISRVEAGARHLQDEGGATIIAIAHTGKNPEKGVRGHSSQPQFADVMVQLIGSAGGQRYDIRVQKNRDGERGLIFGRFMLRKVDLPQTRLGKARSSIVVEELALPTAESEITSIPSFDEQVRDLLVKARPQARKDTLAKPIKLARIIAQLLDHAKAMKALAQDEEDEGDEPSIARDQLFQAVTVGPNGQIFAIGLRNDRHGRERFKELVKWLRDGRVIHLVKGQISLRIPTDTMLP